ncbi:helix-turn-helix domain-containing protein [Micromonospora tarensis]|uniref:Helix-turn-helix domain-containing protein n=1 Tax=Micromonospora tarensis TaxID=2806100 RepID=A0ABS1YR22_9ACTN|nr:helix-turn-helix domain-containing protein [Micromonospora tarensis]MBM0279900.1 helix-turn-helix domain-containing protein [Micromonospora tarensis]
MRSPDRGHSTQPRHRSDPPSGDRPPTWTAEQIRSLGPSTDLATAASVLDMSRSTAYKLIRRDAFPAPHFRVGTHYRIPTAPLLAALHLLDHPEP